MVGSLEDSTLEEDEKGGESKKKEGFEWPYPNNHKILPKWKRIENRCRKRRKKEEKKAIVAAKVN